MYCRQTTGGFISTMGFNPQTFSSFTNNNQNPCEYLIKTKQMNNYFKFLKKQSLMLGKNLKTSIREIIPNSILGCYSPSINAN